MNKSSTKIEKLWIEAKSTVFRWTDEKVPKFIVESRLITLQSKITRHEGIPKSESIGNPTVPNSTWNRGSNSTIQYVIDEFFHWKWNVLGWEARIIRDEKVYELEGTENPMLNNSTWNQGESGTYNIYRVNQFHSKIKRIESIKHINNETWN